MTKKPTYKELEQRINELEKVVAESKQTDKSFQEYDADGNVVQIISCMMDLKDRKPLKSQLIQAQKLESIGTITAGIAHNFRNILETISVNIQVVQLEHKENQLLMSKMERIGAAVRNASNLTDGLMRFSRKKKSKKLYILNLNNVLQGSYDLIRNSFDKKIDVQLNLPKSKLKVMGVQADLSHVILNLCTNARDAMPDGGKLQISAKRKGKRIEIIIADTGHGMDKKTQERCFEPFFTTKKDDKGTGLGLSTSYSIIKAHEGSIEVSSKVGVGTTLIINLPKALEKKSRKKSDIDEVVLGSGQKILIVDDESEIAIPLVTLLVTMGYDATAASSGKAALKKFHSWQPDAILMDINMPGMDGITCAEKIIKKDSNAKIVLFSGYEKYSYYNIDSGIKEMISGYLTKPVELMELNQMLARLFAE